MFVIIDSSTLISASVVWNYESEHGKYRLKAKSNEDSMALFEFLKSNKEKCIITKTVESEAKNALTKCVRNVVEEYTNKGKLPSHLSSKVAFMTLQDIFTNASMDRMENIIEEYSTRLPISILERNSIKEKEIIPFFDDLIPKTQPFLSAPHIPRSIKGSRSGQEDILKAMVDTLPKDGIVYKGYPEDKDLIIMSEAVLICRNHCNGESVYVASLDKHFKPNPRFVGNRFWPFRESVGMQGIDSAVRDMIHKKFGFKGAHPKEILEELSSISKK